MVGGVICCKTVILWLGCHGNSVSWVSHVPVQSVIPVAACWCKRSGGRGRSSILTTILSHPWEYDKQPMCDRSTGWLWRASYNRYCGMTDSEACLRRVKIYCAEQSQIDACRNRQHQAVFVVFPSPQAGVQETLRRLFFLKCHGCTFAAGWKYCDIQTGEKDFWLLSWWQANLYMCFIQYADHQFSSTNKIKNSEKKILLIPCSIPVENVFLSLQSVELFVITFMPELAEE